MLTFTVVRWKPTSQRSGRLPSGERSEYLQYVWAVSDFLSVARSTSLNESYSTEYGLTNEMLPGTSSSLGTSRLACTDLFTAEGNGMDWEYFRFSKTCKPHLVPLGDGNAQLFLVVSTVTALLVIHRW